MSTPHPSKHLLLRPILILIALMLLSLACVDLAELEPIVEEVFSALETSEMAAEPPESAVPTAAPSNQAAAITETAAPTDMVPPTATAEPTAAAIPASLYPPGDFDFLVMSLSWSPDYCATDGENDVQQCAVGRKLGFVLHGLWPNYTRGYPSYCTEEKLPQELEDQFNGLFPSDKLYDHEWEKHGTCSGLSPENYLLASQQLKATTIIPDAYQAPEAPFRTTSQELQAEFASSNPDFSESSVAVYCSGSGRFLKEIFVCYANDGSPTVCSAEVQSKAAKSCGQPDFLVRNIR